MTQERTKERTVTVIITHLTRDEAITALSRGQPTTRDACHALIALAGEADPGNIWGANWPLVYIATLDIDVEALHKLCAGDIWTMLGMLKASELDHEVRAQIVNALREGSTLNVERIMKQLIKQYPHFNRNGDDDDAIHNQ